MKLKNAHILYGPNKFGQLPSVQVVREGDKDRKHYKKEFTPKDLQNDINRLLMAYVEMSYWYSGCEIHEALLDIDEYQQWFERYELTPVYSPKRTKELRL